MPVSHQQWGPYESEFIYFDDRETERERERAIFRQIGWLGWQMLCLVEASRIKLVFIYLFIFIIPSITAAIIILFCFINELLSRYFI